MAGKLWRKRCKAYGRSLTSEASDSAYKNKYGRGNYIKHLGTIRLETERLSLRPFIIDDAEAMLRNWAGDGEVRKFLTWPTHTDSSGSRAVLERWVADYESLHTYQWAIVLKELGQPIGSIAAVRQDDCGNYGIGDSVEYAMLAQDYFKIPQ